MYLIFSVTESGCFQGYAEMKGFPDKDYKPEIFVRSKDAPVEYNDNFKVEWIAKGLQFHFRNLNHFPPNPLNDNKTIMQSKNGQELPHRQGNYLITTLLEEQRKLNAAS